MNTIWSDRDYIRAEIKNLEVQVQVGLHPWEKHPEKPTRLLVNVEMFAHLDRTKNHSQNSIVDYDPIRNAIKEWPKRPHTLLLETLAEEVIELCFQNPRVEACRVSLLKPDIFNEADGAGVEIYRVRK
jgi:7,8-dihydroneopterin aldolase/epimerase/oxygenase